MTKEDILNSYHFKIVKKMLLRELPFIKDVDINESDLKVYNTLFLNITIDPYVLSQMLGLPIWNVITNYHRRGEDYITPFMAMLFDTPTRHEDAKQISDLIENILEGVEKSMTLPKELKLTRPLRLGTIIVPASTLPTHMK